MQKDRTMQKSKTSAKDTWAAIKIIMNSNSTQAKFPKYFQINDMRVVDKKVIANKFNTFFVNIGSKLAQTIPNVDTQKTVNSYLTNKTSHPSCSRQHWREYLKVKLGTQGREDRRRISLQYPLC